MAVRGVYYLAEGHQDEDNHERCHEEEPCSREKEGAQEGP